MNVKYYIDSYNKYFFTIKYLKFRQVLSRIFFVPKFVKMFYFNNINFSWNLRKSYFTQLFFFSKNTFIGDSHITFLNEPGRIPEILWEAKSKSTLWKYNLHYFDWINNKNLKISNQKLLDLMLSWVDSNPVGYQVAWDPYPTSLRIVNWIKFHLNCKKLPKILLQSLVMQANWVSRNIEWHLMANHLLVNGKAMIFSGLFFKGPFACRILSKGLKIFNKELKEQILKDGGHFELSPMYHAIILEDLLDLISLTNSFPNTIPSNITNEWRSVVHKMLNWMKHMSHPDGGISFFNDSTEGVSLNYNDLVSYANKIGLNHFVSKPKPDLIHLVESGYIRLNGSRWASIIDVGSIGPDYQPGHGHADTLSFELSVDKDRFFVNSGISEYTIGPTRLKERSTSVHNTVEVDGLNSSEVWSAFRVAKRAKPFGLLITRKSDPQIIKCAHNGYHRLAEKPTHNREFKVESNKIIIKDYVRGVHKVAIARYHLHPNILVNVENINIFKLTSKNNTTINFKVLCGRATVESSFYCPEFGKRLNSSCIKIELEHGKSEVGVFF